MDSTKAPLRMAAGKWVAFTPYEKARIPRTARVLYSAREMGRIYHAKGVERLVRNSLWVGRTQEQFYDAIQWLHGWRVEDCLKGVVYVGAVSNIGEAQQTGDQAQEAAAKLQGDGSRD